MTMTREPCASATISAGTRNRRGYSLIEMAVVLVVLGLMVVAAVALLPRLTERMRLDSTSVGLDEAAESIDGFVLKQHRLPCPDTSTPSNGLEGTAGTCDAGDEVGTIPYRSLGLPGPVLDEARLPLRYGVYRNPAADADLTTLTNLFEPSLPGALDITRGRVRSCGEVLEGTIQITYVNETESILTVSGPSGTFAIDDIVSGSTLDYDNVVPNTPTSSCPCGGSTPSCQQCTDFVPGEVIFLQGQATDEPPNAEIDSIDGSTLILPFPTGTFEVGDQIEGADSGVVATVTDFYFPGTATITSIISSTQFGVTLIPTERVFFDPNEDFGFVPGQDLFSTSGGTATYVSLEEDQEGLFQVGETVVGQTSNATGDILSDNGTVMTLENVSGTFVGPSAPQLVIDPNTGYLDPNSAGGIEAEGETIVGDTSGADAEIAFIAEDAYADPDVTYGSITIPDPNVTVSGALNELDMCRNLRNGIYASDSIGEVHTVNASAVNVNPAYLIVSGGVEDATPGDVAFDALNEGIATVDFNSPAIGRRADYDDVVHATPMQSLDSRLSCSRNLAAVNAMAVSAMVAQNLAISTFNNHENALAAIEAAWAGLKLAEANVIIEAFNTASAAAECVKATAEAIMTVGGSAVVAAAACAAAVLQVVNFAGAIDSLNTAQDGYEFTCTDELDAGTELFQARTEAAAALVRALEADEKEGVK